MLSTKEFAVAKMDAPIFHNIQLLYIYTEFYILGPTMCTLRRGLVQRMHNCYVGSVLTILRNMEWWKKLGPEAKAVELVNNLWLCNCKHLHANETNNFDEVSYIICCVTFVFYHYKEQFAFLNVILSN